MCAALNSFHLPLITLSSVSISSSSGIIGKTSSKSRSALGNERKHNYLQEAFNRVLNVKMRHSFFLLIVTNNSQTLSWKDGSKCVKMRRIDKQAGWLNAWHNSESSTPVSERRFNKVSTALNSQLDLPSDRKLLSFKRTITEATTNKNMAKLKFSRRWTEHILRK